MNHSILLLGSKIAEKILVAPKILSYQKIISKTRMIYLKNWMITSARNEIFSFCCDFCSFSSKVYWFLSWKFVKKFSKTAHFVLKWVILTTNGSKREQKFIKIDYRKQKNWILILFIKNLFKMNSERFPHFSWIWHGRFITCRDMSCTQNENHCWNS